MMTRLTHRSCVALLILIPSKRISIALSTKNVVADCMGAELGNIGRGDLGGAKMFCALSEKKMARGEETVGFAARWLRCKAADLEVFRTELTRKSDANGYK